MLRLGTAFRTQSVDLVDEDDAGRVESRHLEQVFDHFLALPSVLGRERGGGDVEEGRLALGGHRLGQHCLARARRTDHEDSLPRTTDAPEELGHDQGQHDGFLQEGFGLVKT